MMTFAQLNQAIEISSQTNLHSTRGLEVRYDFISADRILLDLHLVMHRLRVGVHGLRLTDMECGLNACDGELVADGTSPEGHSIW